MTTYTVYDYANRWTYSDLTNILLDDIQTVSVSSTRLVGSAGGFLVTFSGSFTFSGGQLSGGTVTGISMTHQGHAVASYTDFRIGIIDLAYAYDINQELFGGDDTIVSYWNHDDQIWAYSGNDRIRLGTGDDIIEAGSGTDTFVTMTKFAPGQISHGYDVLVIDGAYGRDQLYDVEIVEFLDAKMAVRFGTYSSQQIEGDTFAATKNDYIAGQGGNDTILGRTGNDRLFGDGGNDNLRGGNGEDYLSGGSGDDTLAGEKGWDRLVGGAGNDKLLGGDGLDTLLGGGGEDILDGGAHDDRLLGGGRADDLFGGAGNDVLIGGAGNDRLNGHVGNDILTGGAGKDVFYFRSGHGNDVITDFEIGRDLIEIGKGASRFSQLDFERQGQHVLVSFDDVSVLVEGVRVADLRDADNFLL